MAYAIYEPDYETGIHSAQGHGKLTMREMLFKSLRCTSPGAEGYPPASSFGIDCGEKPAYYYKYENDHMCFFFGRCRVHPLRWENMSDERIKCYEEVTFEECIVGAVMRS